LYVNDFLGIWIAVIGPLLANFGLQMTKRRAAT
jgi:hypothetical protein